MIHELAVLLATIVKGIVGVFIILNIVWACLWIIVVVRVGFKNARNEETIIDGLMGGTWLIILFVSVSALLMILGINIFNFIFT